jgi:hypothetical protein
MLRQNVEITQLTYPAYSLLDNATTLGLGWLLTAEPTPSAPAASTTHPSMGRKSLGQMKIYL